MVPEYLQNDEVQESLERYDGYLGRLSLLEKEITGHEEDSGLY